MPTPGLSLVGFMDQNRAIQHLALDCQAPSTDPAVLVAAWQAARQKLGAATPNAGAPEILPLPAAAQAHMTQFVALMGGAPPGFHFQMVEIDPLLAYQFTVCKARSDSKCNGLTKPPTIAELLNLALPLAQPQEQFQPFPGPKSILLKARSLNLRTQVQGFINMQLAGGANAQFLGVQFGVSAPMVHVVRYNGRCYLFNGFHRCLGARLAGATHIPCVFRDLTNANELGIVGNNGAFQLPLLESADPPTLGHYTQGRAWDVTLREFWRFIHVSWEEYAVPID